MKIEIRKQTAIEAEKYSDALPIFGKYFRLEKLFGQHCIIIHEDYPLINENDIEQFVAYAIEKTVCVISGCRANIHPYRLMYIDDTGHDAFCVNVPQSIRGNRHLYPEIYQFVPALISIPPKMRLNSLSCYQNFDMFVMPGKKFLDQSLLTERLLIKVLKN
jgi:hypothetical protein